MNTAPRFSILDPAAALKGDSSRMRQIMEAGTDGGSICFFDPAALPGDFDQQMSVSPGAAYDDLATNGRFWWGGDGDGGYIVHFYVDEKLPEEIARFGKEHDSADRFAIPSGTIWCCGVEYAARDPLIGYETAPTGGLRRFPHMGGKFQIAPGGYSLKVLEMVWPKGYVPAQVRARVGSGAYRLAAALDILCVVLLVGGTLALIGLLFSLTRDWRAWASAAGAVGLGLLIANQLAKLPALRARKDIAQQYPEFAVELHRLGPLPS